MGECGIVPDGQTVCLGQRTMLFRLSNELLLPEYLTIAIRSPGFQMRMKKAGVGSTVKHLRVSDVELLTVPIPPVEEQRTIVKNVDDLLQRVDYLETYRNSRQTHRRALYISAINALTSAETPEALTTAWARLRDQWEIYTSDEDSIDQLRQAILQLAVQGRLVPQVEGTGDGVSLMRDIAEKRSEYVKRGEIKKSTILQLESASYPFSIPSSWAWSNLDSILIFGPTNGYSPQASELPTAVKSLTLSATTSGKFDGSHVKFVDISIPADSDLWLHEGDILVQRGNTIDYVGVPAIYRGAPNQYIYPDLMMKIRVSELLDVEFVHMAMSSRPLRDYLRSRASGTSSSMPKINQEGLRSLPIPIPPMEEQRRIVQKYRDMMLLCDQLGTTLKSRRKTQESLAISAIADLLAS